MRVLMTGGGTGGHVNPALAIADIIKRNQPGSEIAFVGTKRGIENSLVPKAGYKLYHINIQGIKRSLSLSNLKTAYLVMTSPREAKKIIREFNPDIVIGTGGYVCWPLLKAAASMNIPTVVHESNAIAGVAVKQLKNKVDIIMTNFESTAEQLDARARVMRVGNPMSSDFGRYTKAEARRILGIPDSVKHVILSCGGSLGAHKVNEAVLKLMRDLVAGREDIIHFHASGRNDSEYAKQTFAKFGLEGRENIVMSEYIYNMPVVMAAADIVICRAGAMTLSEIATMKRAAVIIPSPNVTDNHQYKNALVYAENGAAVLIEEKDLTPERLTKEIDALLTSPEKLAKMSENMKKLAHTGASDKIWDEICKIRK